VKLQMLAGLAQIPLRVDMVYWPTPGARLCRRPLRSSAPYQSRRCCRRGHVNRNAVQGAAREQVPSW
jgi:hypothetical protein